MDFVPAGFDFGLFKLLTVSMSGSLCSQELPTYTGRGQSLFVLSFKCGVWGLINLKMILLKKTDQGFME